MNRKLLLFAGLAVGSVSLEGIEKSIDDTEFIRHMEIFSDPTSYLFCCPMMLWIVVFYPTSSMLFALTY